MKFFYFSTITRYFHPILLFIFYLSNSGWNPISKTFQTYSTDLEPPCPWNRFGKYQNPLSFHRWCYDLSSKCWPRPKKCQDSDIVCLINGHTILSSTSMCNGSILMSYSVCTTTSKVLKPPWPMPTPQLSDPRLKPKADSSDNSNLSTRIKFP